MIEQINTGVLQANDMGYSNERYGFVMQSPLNKLSIYEIVDLEVNMVAERIGTLVNRRHWLESLAISAMAVPNVLEGSVPQTPRMKRSVSSVPAKTEAEGSKAWRYQH